MAQTGVDQPDPATASMQSLSRPMTLDNQHLRATPSAGQATTPMSVKQLPNAAWTLGPASSFELTRFDGAFVPGLEGEAWANKVYFLGGRSGENTEDPTIWSFEPQAGTYADTGADLVEDVSNYTANVIPDDGTGRGPAIYIIGGTNADGAPAGPIGTVQRYYPQTNVVEALPAADDWTVTVAGTLVAAMGQAVVDNAIYVFGGWEDVTAPYFYAGTWMFDPTQPSGSRWIDLSLNLNPARSSIQVAVQGTKIFALGGHDSFAGSDLEPTTVVEVLDTADLASGWVSLPSMPVASGEGRGFGFDADTINAPDPWNNHLYVVGGGNWPDSTAEAMEYLVNNDTWDQAFPDLINARRNQAGVFIPTCTADPTDGLPGLWVFGGRMTADAPPFGPTEFYPLDCAQTVSVLLVDDDWDFKSTVPESVGGLFYYTETLDALGYAYDVWDTVSQGDPSASDMISYTAVIWFTGYAWQNGVFTPQNETDVAAYLDGGGHFILSSQEYAFEAGTVTSFMQNYLGISSFPGLDVSELDPVGSAGNPIGDGLGPYTMVRPDIWYTYWPTGTFEGPYDDYVMADIGAVEPFNFSVSAQPNSTNYDDGVFRTVYLAWPFEWIGDLANRQEILGAALDWLIFNIPGGAELNPPRQTGLAEVGETIVYTLTLVNNIGSDQTFDLSYTHIWPVTGPATVGPVPNGGRIDFNVEVTVPLDADCQAEDAAIVTAWDATGTYSDTAELTSTNSTTWLPEDNTGATGAYWLAFACTEDYGTAGACFYAGGIGAGNEVTGDAQMYDIASGIWTSLPDLPTPVFGATGGFIDDKFYVAGGFTTSTDDWGGTYALQVYDTAGGSWSSGPAMPDPGGVEGAGGSAGGVVDGRLHVVGGCGSNVCSSNQHAAFDPVAGAWVQLTAAPDFLVFHGAAAGSGKLFIGGGYGGATGFYEYLGASDEWVSRSPLPDGAGKKSPVGVALAEGVFWWGGDLGAWASVQDSTWYWDATSATWIQYAGTLNQATTSAGGGLADGRLWSFGGSLGSGSLAPPPHESLSFCIPLEPEVGNLDQYCLDANTGLGIPNAYVYIENAADADVWKDGFTDADGRILFENMWEGEYLVMASANHYELSILPSGWPTGAVTTTVSANLTTTIDLSLDASQMVLGSTEPLTLTQEPGTTMTYTLNVANTGTAPLLFTLNVLDSAFAAPPPARAIPELPRIDPQIAQDMAASPDGTADFFVALGSQADLSAANTITDWQARGQYVYDTLKQHAEANQIGLRKYLDTRGASYTPLFIVNGVIVHGGNQDLVDSLAARPDVTQIIANRQISVEEVNWVDKLLTAPLVPTAVEWNIQQVGAEDVWTLGYNGTGMVVSEIDMGTQWDHPALQTHYRGWDGETADHDYNWFDPYGQSPGGGTIPGDAHGHGTHVMGTMVGDDGGANQIGMAPGAKWISCKGGDNVTFHLLTNELLMCAQWILAPTDVYGNNPDPAMRPNVVNNSWGGGQGDYWYSGAVAAWRAAGIFPAFSNGNEGPGCSTAGSPGDNLLSFSSGATNISDGIAGFSSRGPSAIFGLLKPNISAPGVNIRSSVPGSGYQGLDDTSMASPHTAGAVALVWSAAPELLGQVDLTAWLLEQTAAPITTTQGCGGDLPTDIPNNTFGWGRLNALEAVQTALAGGVTSDWINVDPLYAEVLPGDSITVSIEVNAPVTLGTYTATLWMVADDPYIQDVRWPIELQVEGAVPPVYKVFLPLVWILP